MTSRGPLYESADPVANGAQHRDDSFFSRNPRQVWRVRPLLEGESTLAEGVHGEGGRAYALVINHARSGDRRAKMGRVVYPVVVHDPDKGAARLRLSEKALRWVKWFNKHAVTPPTMRRTGVVLGGGP